MPQREEADDVIDLGQLLRVLWRGKFIIAVVAALCVLVGGYYAYVVATPVYRSTSVILLETQQQGLTDLQGLLGGMSGETTEVNSELEVLRARGLVEDVVRRLDLQNDPEFNVKLREPGNVEQVKIWLRETLSPEGQEFSDPAAQAERTLDNVVTAVRDRLGVRNIPNSLVFEITFESNNPQKAARITRAVTQAYLDRQVEVKFVAIERATEWLSTRVAELQSQLETAEQARASFSSSTDLVSAEGLQVLERQLKDLRDRISDQRATIARDEASIAALQATSDPARLAELSGDRTLQRLAQALDGSANRQEVFDARLEQVLDDKRAAIARSQVQVRNLERSAADFEAQIERQSADLIRLQQLNREAESIRLLYETFLTRLNETAAQQGVQQPDSVVLSNAVVPQVTSAPRKSLILAMSGILGLMLGGLIVLLLEARRRGVRTATDLQNRTGLPVLGQIPLIAEKKRAKTIAYIRDKPASAAAEAIRNLRTGVLYSNIDNPPQVVMITSSIPSEGKTLTSISLAMNLAAAGGKVLLIEGDIRRRTFGSYFKNLKSRGVVSVLTDEAPLSDAVQHYKDFGIDVLAGEDSMVNAADLYSSKRFAKMVANAREVYDHIVIDTPPVLVVPDARIIANVADALLVCVKWDSTSVDQIDETLRLFRVDSTPVTGVVLTQVNPKGMKRYGYGGAYGAYGKYGGRYYTN
ncbi:GumC family protein [Thalassorhabdomicrobium marinisediminis]|uniref:GumC family protein n=1 Tax=Thalassorhabdomicrobium marinisediminis TaxID=2170577 RepID=UPI00248F57B6|nr:polysaccharide biosynthesis tyrosine autokinase [Thalassorhabdomicrobium marinisediminis]